MNWFYLQNLDLIEIIEDHLHKPSLVYPTGAAGTTVTCGDAAAWTLGDYAQIIPASTVGDEFDIHHLNVESASANTTYELVLYATTTEIGRIRFTKAATIAAVGSHPIQTPVVAADTQIQAKVMSATGSDDAVVVSLYYHVY